MAGRDGNRNCRAPQSCNRGGKQLNRKKRKKEVEYHGSTPAKELLSRSLYGSGIDKGQGRASTVLTFDAAMLRL